MDVLVARAPLPFTPEEMRTAVLHEQPRVVVVRTDHPLAGRTAVTPADLAGEQTAPCPQPAGGPNPLLGDVVEIARRRLATDT